MSFFRDHNTTIIVSTMGAALGFGAAFYFMKSRRKGRIFISKEKIMYPAANSDSKVSAPLQNKVEEDLLVETKKPPITDDNTTNIGFGTDPSWLIRAKDENVIGKTDLLHTGNSKGGKLVIVMIGLPGCGKTYIARKVSRYLRWISYRTRVFSVAKYR